MINYVLNEKIMITHLIGELIKKGLIGWNPIL